MRAKAASVTDYIAGFPKDVQKILKQILATIKKAAPKSEEVISYGIPAFKLNGRAFAYFAGFRNHVSFFPAPRGVQSFKKEISAYKGGKGTAQFPLDKPMPLGLISRMVKFRLKENLAKAAVRKSRKASRSPGRG